MDKRRSIVGSIWSTLNIPVTLIGLIGLPQNIRDWGALFRMLDPDTLRWIILIVATLSWICLLWYLHATKPKEAELATQPAQPTTECRFCKGTGHDPQSSPKPGVIFPCRICQGTGVKPS